jgi:SNF2 family DNA or RNA helicase
VVDQGLKKSDRFSDMIIQEGGRIMVRRIQEGGSPCESTDFLKHPAELALMSPKRKENQKSYVFIHCKSAKLHLTSIGCYFAEKILVDEMTLGKTIKILALFTVLKNHFGIEGAFLVVARVP